MVELPRYRKVYETLRRQIADGKYSPGELLPSENEMCRTYGITRPTVRKALDLLAIEGFIVRHQGKGSIVKGSPKAIGILSLTSTTSAVGASPIQTKIIAGPELRQWSEAFAFPLTAAEKQAGCIYFERLRIIDGTPVIIDITMLPNIGIPRFTTYNLENASLFDLLRTKYQIDVTGGIQQLDAIPASKHIRSLLGVRPGYPILQVSRRIDTSRDGFSIYSQLFCNTANYSLSGTF